MILGVTMTDKYMKITRELAGREEEILKAFGMAYFSVRSRAVYNRLCLGIKLDDDDAYFYSESEGDFVYTISQQVFERLSFHEQNEVVLGYKIKYRNS